MSDKVELVAAAQVNADAGGISFKSNYKFKTAAKNGTGAYELTLDDKHDGHKLVIQLTANNLTGSEIQGSPGSSGDTRTINITNFNLAGDPADTPFYILVYRIR